jgi:outer membrane protein assembly factor BamB
MDAARVYVPLSDGRLAVLSRLTGEAVWDREVRTSWPPIPVQESVYIATEGTLDEHDASTGETRRQIPLPGRPTGPMTLAGELLLVTVTPDRLVAIRTRDGHTAWQTGFGGVARLPGAVDADRRTVYHSLDDGRLAAVSLETGKLLWTTARLGESLSPPVAARDRAFVGSTDNAFFAFDAGTGRQVWYWSTGGDVVGAASMDDLVFFVSLDNTVRAVSRDTGNQRWIQPLTTRPTSPPLIASGTLLVTGISPRLRAFNGRTGEPGEALKLEPDANMALLAGPPLLAARASADDSAAEIVLVMRDGAVIGFRSGPARAAKPDSSDTAPAGTPTPEP